MGSQQTLDLTNGTLKLQPRRSDAAVQLTAKSIKLVLVLDLAAVAAALAPFATVEQRVPVTVAVEARHLKAEFAPRAVRKVLEAIAEHGPDNVAVLIQGKLLRGNVIGEAGLMAQPKMPKPAAA